MDRLGYLISMLVQLQNYASWLDVLEWNTKRMNHTSVAMLNDVVAMVIRDTTV